MKAFARVVVGGALFLIGLVVISLQFSSNSGITLLLIAVSCIGLILLAIGVFVLFAPFGRPRTFAIDPKIRLNIIRTSIGEEYQIGSDSKVCAIFRGGQFWWKIQVVADRDGDRSGIKCDLALPIDVSARRWTELPNLVSEEHWSRSAAFPISPGIAGGYFDGMHLTVTDQLICFAEQKEGMVEINCVIRASYSEMQHPDSYDQICFRAKLSFSEVQVILGNDDVSIPDVAEISQRLGVPQLELVARDRYEILYKCVFPSSH